MESKNNITQEMKDSKFHQLFLHELKDIYWAETHLAEKLPMISQKATSKKLAEAIEKHKKETDNQVKRLEKVFELLDEKAKGETCQAMKGLLEEAEEILGDTDSDSVTRDAGIIIACQKVEHYEIASYGSLVSMAKAMNHDECSKLLKETLDEEKKTDELLTDIAENEVNNKAKKE
jgi:ferritin-like metal-binding protein YciE